MTGKKTSELLQVLSSAVVHGGEIVIVTPKTIKVPISSLNNHFLSHKYVSRCQVSQFHWLESSEKASIKLACEPYFKTIL